ncbi:MAG TPA: ATP-binding protein [Oculatellaceae cyanobacterium]
MISVYSSSKLSDTSRSPLNPHRMSLQSTLLEMQLYDFKLEFNCLAKEAALLFEENPVLPGIIVTQEGEFIGIISRRRFLESLSRPYGLEIFLKRPLSILYNFAQTEPLIFQSNTLIVMAARRALQRDSEFLYEPIVVQVGSQYQLLDVHDLLVAQSQIHELTTQLLQKQTQSKIMQTEKLASLGRMMAGLAHEILNPVNFIYGNLGHLSEYTQNVLELLSTYDAEFIQPNPKIEALKESLELDFIVKDLPQVVESMTLGTERLIKIISSLRTFSHMDETTLQEVNIHECIDSTLLILNNRIKTGIEVIKTYGELPLLNGYSGQLSQVFMNILSNAIDALMEKWDAQAASQKQVGRVIEQTNFWQPQIEISTEVRVQEIEQTSTDNGRWVAILIKDNGTGIPLEIQQRIFETFFTTKPVGKGTGLGLAISHQIITEKHQGKLNLTSQAGVGTQFEILLPLI